MKIKKMVSVLFTTLIIATGVSGCSNGDTRTLSSASEGAKTVTSQVTTLTSAIKDTRTNEQKDGEEKTVSQPESYKEKSYNSQNSQTEIVFEDVSEECENNFNDDSELLSHSKENKYEISTTEAINETTTSESKTVEEAKWAVVRVNTVADTDFGNFPIEAGTYIRVISMDEDMASYVIEWYESSAKVSTSSVNILENLTPEQEKAILLKRTAGVVT